jgi:hypothetical protein
MEPTIFIQELWGIRIGRRIVAIKRLCSLPTIKIRASVFATKDSVSLFWAGV